MPSVTRLPLYEQIPFLASAKFISYTYQIDDDGVQPNEFGRKIVPAGTVYPANDATAIGITLTDTDVTAGPQPGAVLVEAWIIEDRLPEEVTEEAKAAMQEIKFKVIV